MPARVFISCGQGSLEERAAANAVRTWLISEGFDAYVAVNVQTIADLNAGIIGAIRTSDYYLFIDFPREPLVGGSSLKRGSLYSHQELAIAYALDFENILLVKHEDVLDEGVGKFIVSNIPKAKNHTDVLGLVQSAVAKAGWSNTYSRHLSLSRLRWGPPVIYGDHTGRRKMRVLHGDIANGRPDSAAFEVVAHLASVRDSGIGGIVDHKDTSVLKASGHIGYAHTIWPKKECSFDLLAINLDRPHEVFLNSSLDLNPRQPIISSVGKYEFQFEFIGDRYPLLKVTFELAVGTLPVANPAIV
jgi:hypothetical protein